MKIKYFFSLIIFILLSAICLIFDQVRDDQILGFVFFVTGFSITYLFMVKGAIENRDAVVKIGEKKPFVIPFMFFSIPTIISMIIMSWDNHQALSQSLGFLAFSTVFYLTGTFYLLSNFKKDLKKSNESKQSISGKKKLVLINPVNRLRIGLTVNKSSIFPPLGLGVIASLTPDDYEIVIIDENIEPFHYEKADLVGITAFTSSANRAYEIASIYKKNNIPVIMGGIHSSMLPEEALMYADSVVIGEAENVWAEVLSDFENKSLKKIYSQNLSDLQNQPLVRRDLFSSQYLFATLQTSRGCPMDCNFCSVTPFNGREYRQRPVEEVLKEIESIKNNYLFFVDDNILGYGKQAESRAIELFKGMAERGFKKSWFCQASVNFGNNDEVLYWASKSGCRMVFIGLESDNPEELREMNKNLNMKTEYKQCFDRIHKYGISVLGAFIFGSDYETPETMKLKTDFMIKSGCDVIQTTVMTPLPGTRLYKKYHEENRLKYCNYPEDWNKYDLTESVFHMDKMSEMEFQKILDKCLKRVYSSKEIYTRFFKTLIATRSFTSSFFALESNKTYRSINKLYASR